MYSDDYHNSSHHNRSGGYGSGASSYRGSDEHQGSDKAEELLGGLITLPSNIAPIANFLKNTVKPHIAERGEGIVGQHLPGLLEKTGLSTKTAHNVSDRTAAALAYFIIFSDEMAGTIQNFSRFVKGRKQLAEELSPVAKAHGAGLGVSGLLHSGLAHNEVVEVAKSHLRKRWVQETFSDMSGLAASFSALYMHVVNKKAERAELTHQTNEDDFFDRYNEFKNNANKKGIADEAQIDRLWESNIRQQGHGIRQHREDSAKKRDTLNQFVVPGGAALAEFLRGYFIEKEKKDSTKATALEMIRNLSDTVINDKEATGVDGVPFEAFVRKIFETHQENMHQPKIGKRFDEKMDYACKEIASAITEGKLHPMALVNLVGERKIVKDKGKHIAPREEIKQAIAEQIKLMPAKFAVDPEEYLAEAAVGEHELKLALKDLKENDRAFFISLLPEEVAKKLGLSEAEIKAAHETAKQGFAENLSKAVLDLATLSDEQLKASKLSDEQIAVIRDVAPKAKEGKQEEVLEAVGKKGEFKNTLDSVIVDAIGAGAEHHLGDLYEKAGHKIFAEHEHPAGQYEPSALENAAHTDDKAHAEKDGWEALDDGHESHHHEASLHEEHAQEAEDKKPLHTVHQAQHQGMERSPSQELGA